MRKVLGLTIGVVGILWGIVYAFFYYMTREECDRYRSELEQNLSFACVKTVMALTETPEVTYGKTVMLEQMILRSEEEGLPLTIRIREVDPEKQILDVEGEVSYEILRGKRKKETVRKIVTWQS